MQKIADKKKTERAVVPRDAFPNYRLINSTNIYWIFRYAGYFNTILQTLQYRNNRQLLSDFSFKFTRLPEEVFLYSEIKAAQIKRNYINTTKG